MRIGVSLEIVVRLFFVPFCRFVLSLAFKYNEAKNEAKDVEVCL